MTQKTKIINHLMKYGSITSLEMFNTYFICCPQSAMRNARKKLECEQPDYCISDKWIEKKKEIIDDNGKKRKVYIRYKLYFLKKKEEKAA